MPHCIVEYSTDLEKLVTAAQLISAVYQAALQSELFQDQDIKTRALAFEHYQAGAVKQEFVHVTIKLLGGRTLAQREQLSHLVLAQLSQLGLSAVSLTVAISEIETGSYAKRVV
jgi:5-carboxymethyl-2-hydroxymuconate isomerase